MPDLETEYYPSGTERPQEVDHRRYKDRGRLTVAEVLQGLQELVLAHPEALECTVALEGCDCSGDMVAVAYYPGALTVEFERND